MKELRRNMRLIGALIIAAFVVLCAGYALTVYTQGGSWASTAYNTRNNASNALRGDITDRDGVTLAATDEDGARVYVSNTTARRALSQTVGDVSGMAGALLLGWGLIAITSETPFPGKWTLLPVAATGRRWATSDRAGWPAAPACRLSGGDG